MANPLPSGMMPFSGNGTAPPRQPANVGIPRPPPPVPDAPTQHQHAPFGQGPRLGGGIPSARHANFDPGQRAGGGMMPQAFPAMAAPQASPTMAPIYHAPPAAAATYQAPPAMTAPSRPPVFPPQNAPQQVHNQGPPPKPSPAQRPKKRAVVISDIRNECLTEADARQRLSSYYVIRMEKVPRRNEVDEEGNPAQPTWQMVKSVEDTDTTQQEVTRRVRQLIKEGPRVLDKKNKLGPSVQRQIQKAKETLEEHEPDSRYKYVLAQLDSTLKKMSHFSVVPHTKTYKKGKKGKECKYTWLKAKHPYERVSVTAYFQRTPRDGENAMRMWDEQEKARNRPKNPPAAAAQQQQQAVPPTQPSAPPQPMPPAQPQHPGHPAAGQPMGPGPGLPGQMYPYPGLVQPMQPAPQGPPMHSVPPAQPPMYYPPLPSPGRNLPQGRGGRADIDVISHRGRRDSPRDSRSSVSSDDYWSDTESSGYTTQMSSVGSSSRHSRHCRHRSRSRSRSRHRRRTRPDLPGYFGVAAPRDHSRELDYGPPSPARHSYPPVSPALAPPVDLDRVRDEAFRDGREEQLRRDAPALRIMQRPSPPYRRISGRDVRRELWRDRDMDEMSDLLSRSRLSDEAYMDGDWDRYPPTARYRWPRGEVDVGRRLDDRHRRVRFDASPPMEPPSPDRERVRYWERTRERSRERSRETDPESVFAPRRASYYVKRRV
ncbi:hypothetical protein CDD83_11106 [Cordyceps sp. RAO-2017]|nr:hypothetical protein CDD83_11106 [Cordyceps sp. RAO-2017]